MFFQRSAQNIIIGVQLTSVYYKLKFDIGKLLMQNKYEDFVNILILNIKNHT